MAQVKVDVVVTVERNGAKEELPGTGQREGPTMTEREMETDPQGKLPL